MHIFLLKVHYEEGIVLAIQCLRRGPGSEDDVKTETDTHTVNVYWDQMWKRATTTQAKCQRSAEAFPWGIIKESSMAEVALES